MSVSGTPVTTYDDGFPKAHPSLPPSTRRSGRGVVHRRTLVELTDDHESLATRVVDPTLSTAERAGGVGGALGNPSSYVGTGVPTTDRRAVGQTVRSGFPRPHPPPPPGGSAAIGSPQFRTETLRLQQVPQTVAEQVQAQHGERDGAARKHGEPGADAQKVLSLFQHEAPRGIRRLRAQAEIRERGL